MGKTLFRENRNVADGTTQPVHPACRGSVAVPNRLLAQRYGPSTIEHSLNSTNVTCAACNEDARPILLIELGPEEPRYHDPCVRRLPRGFRWGMYIGKVIVTMASAASPHTHG